MQTIFYALLSGLVFGIGLLISGLANPVKVQDFLDLAGLWDPSLALVMGGAIAVALVPFTLARRHPVTLGSAKQVIQLPTTQSIDRPLVIGAMLFGVGWGLLGMCPGPALVLMGSGSQTALLFVLAMVGGMRLHKILQTESAK